MFPHSEIPGSRLIYSSPRLIAVSHVLHRLLMPRHSPYALLRLNFSKRISRFSLLGSRSILNCLSFVNKYLLGFLFALKKLPFSLLLNLHLSVKLFYPSWKDLSNLFFCNNVTLVIKSVLLYLFVLLFNILYSVFNEHI